MISTEAQGGRFPRLIQAAIDAFSLPDLRAKILFTLAILALYRFTAHIPLPGIDGDQLDRLIAQMPDSQYSQYLRKVGQEAG